MWALRRTDQGGGYIADMRKSRGGSYTSSLLIAKLYRTREEAVADSCQGNEVPVDLGYNQILEGR